MLLTSSDVNLQASDVEFWDEDAGKIKKIPQRSFFCMYFCKRKKEKKDQILPDLIEGVCGQRF